MPGYLVGRVIRNHPTTIEPEIDPSTYPKGISPNKGYRLAEGTEQWFEITGGEWGEGGEPEITAKRDPATDGLDTKL